jgi:3-oxoacyl-[acyl-carrier protein] reductase
MQAADRVAVVLAGTRGLGRACAEALAEGGHAVVVCGRNEATLAETVESLRSLGGAAEGVVADVSDAAATEAVVEDAARAFGRVDVLVANAGGPPAGGFAELEAGDWDAAFRLTLMSAVVAIRSVVPLMRDQRRGRVVVIGSSSVRSPLTGLLLSNVFRPALDGLVKSLAVELGRDGITVNMVAPGKIDTERVRQLDRIRAERSGSSEADQRAQTESTIPAGRYGRPDELASLVRFLASDEAQYISGQCVLVDGGLVPTLP